MHIGLVAMSGVRVQDPELRAWGMTLPGFVERGEVIACMPSLGLLTLAGLTPCEHTVAYLEVDQVAEAASLPTFDLVALSTLTARAYEAYGIADRLRHRGIPVVIGGLHATAVPEEALQHADAVVVGEGEASWPRILKDAEAGRLGGTYRAPGEFDLSGSPTPAFRLLDIARYNRLPVQTTRGCPWRCTFCASSILLSAGYKHKPAETVLAEIDAIKQQWPRPFIEVTDDNSFRNRRYWYRLLPEIAKRGVRWFTEADIGVADAPYLLGLMRRSGCEEILVGLESPNPAELRALERRRDWKRQRLAGYGEAVHRIQSHGIRVNGCFILGLDGQTADIFEQLPAYIEALGLYDAQITLATPFPGSDLYRKLREEGRLFEERPWDRMTLFDLTFQPRPMSTRELREGFRVLARAIYSKDATQQRRNRFRERFLRPARRAERRGLLSD